MAGVPITETGAEESRRASAAVAAQPRPAPEATARPLPMVGGSAPPPGQSTGQAHGTGTLPGQQKVKYFGRELPPKCALRTCWLTDDGQHFYCVDFSCNRHKYRRTKHNRYSRYRHLDPEQPPSGGNGRTSAPAAASSPGHTGQPGSVGAGRGGEPQHPWPLVHFRCPECGSSDIQMRLLQNRYECTVCSYAWR